MDITDRLLYLVNRGDRRNSTEETEFHRLWDEYMDRGNETITLATENEESGSDEDDADNNVDNNRDSDLSDLDGPFVNEPPLPELRLQAFDSVEIDVPVIAEIINNEEPEQAVSPNRGQKYKGQGRRDNTIWWSLPSPTEIGRAQNLASNRKASQPCSLATYIEKDKAFKRLIPESLIEYIVLETNRKAKKKYEENNRLVNPKKLRPWYDTNANEVYAYIAIIIFAGAEKSNLVAAKDLFDKSHMAFYRAVMSLERFEQLSRFLRFDDTRTRQSRLREDKLAPFRHVWTVFQNNLNGPFSPSQELTVDEQLVSTRGRCSFRQYIPSKPGKYGIKIFWLVDARTNYPLSGEIYLGTQPNEERSTGIAHQLVLRLSKQFLDKGYNITMDNFFTSYPLAKELFRRNTTLVGTIRPNKAEIPIVFAKKEIAAARGVSSSAFCFSDEVSLVSYTTNTKKNVLLLSTAHATDTINELTKKPEIIHGYNENKGGVDTFDKMCRSYTCRRKTNRWPMTLFFNLVDVAALASYRLYELSHSTSWNTRKSEKRKIFLKELAMSLARDHIEIRSHTTKSSSVQYAMNCIGYKVSAQPSSFPQARSNTKPERCVPCKASRTKSKDTKTTAVCDLCCKATCSKHYIRVCENCYITKCTISNLEENEDDLSFSIIDDSRASTPSSGIPGTSTAKHRSRTSSSFTEPLPKHRRITPGSISPLHFGEI